MIRPALAWLTDARRRALESTALLILRLGAGGTMLFAHGLGKLSAFGEKSGSFPDPLGVGSTLSMALAVFAEVVCAALVMAGLATRLALIPLITTMLVAMLLVHGGDPWAKQEPAFVFLIMYVTLLLAGPGRWSLDAQVVERLRAKDEG